MHRTEAERAIAFANVLSKDRYDNLQKMIRLKAGDKVFLRLHHGYKIPGEPNKKLSNQRCGPFTIERRIGHLAFELGDLLAHWKIHPVISIAQLEPVPAGDDPWERKRPDNSPSIQAEGDDDEWQTFEVDKLLPFAPVLEIMLYSLMEIQSFLMIPSVIDAHPGIVYFSHPECEEQVDHF